MNRTIMICLSVLLVALGLTACAQAVSKAAAEQSTVPSAADSTEQNVLPENTEPPAPEMIDFEVNRYAVTAGAAAYLGGAEEQYKALVDAVCSKKETEPYTDEDAAKRAVEVFAGYVVSVENDAWNTSFISGEEFTQWLTAAQERSLFSSAIDPAECDRIITLSTCSYEFYNARFIALYSPGKNLLTWAVHMLS